MYVLRSTSTGSTCTAVIHVLSVVRRLAIPVEEETEKSRCLDILEFSCMRAPVRDPLKSPGQSERQIRPIWRSQSSTGILLHVRAPRAICMPPIYGYLYVYSQSIFRIQNSEYAFHFICVFLVNFQKHATLYSDACF